MSKTKTKKINIFKFRPLDTLFLFFTTITVLMSLFIVSMIRPPSGNMVEIYYDFKLYATYNLAEDNEIEMKQKDLNLLLGDMTIEIKDGAVRIAKETSPQNVCSKQGWTNNSFKVLICDPNRVLVKISTGSDNTIPDDIPPGNIG